MIEMIFRFGLLLILAGFSISPVAQNRDYSAEELERAAGLCEEGDANICYTLGNMYERGDRVGAISAKKSVDFYGRSCELDDSRGCFAMGLVYGGQVFEEISGDINKSSNYFSKGCDLGAGNACANFASLELQYGTPHTALKYLDRACDLGVAGACAIAAKVLQEGSPKWSLEPDLERAKAYLFKACKRGFTDACGQ